MKLKLLNKSKLNMKITADIDIQNNYYENFGQQRGIYRLFQKQNCIDKLWRNIYLIIIIFLENSIFSINILTRQNMRVQFLLKYLEKGRTHRPLDLIKLFPRCFYIKTIVLLCILYRYIWFVIMLCCVHGRYFCCSITLSNILKINKF